MDRLLWQRKYKNFRDFLLRLVNKEFLIFLFFLVVSATFWFLTSLNEWYEMDIKVPLRLTSVPEQVIITDNLPDTVKVTIKDKGFNLLKYTLNPNTHPINLPFNLYKKQQKGKGGITPAEVQKIMKARLSETTTILAVKANHWDFYYCEGTRRRVPIVISGSISPRSSYYVSHTELTPDSIYVYATSEALDTIRAVYTEHLTLNDIASNITRKVKLQKIHGAKLEKEEMSISVFTDQLTEITINVPIKTINVPENVSLKTFPARMEVRVAVGVQRSGNVKPELFTVVADYKDVPADPNDKLPLKILSQPRGIVKAFLKQHQVDYLIENISK